MKTTRSEKLFKEACELIPGGVNSPVRAFGSVGETPRFIASAKGAYMTDADGQTYEVYGTCVKEAGVTYLSSAALLSLLDLYHAA